LELTNLAETNQQIQLSQETSIDYGDGAQPEEGNDLMLSQIKTQLLPLHLKEEVLEMSFSTTVDSADVDSAMNDIVAEIRLHKDNALSDILGTVKEAVSPNTKYNTCICPALKKLGIPHDDTRVHQSILKDLYWIN
jgi:hypothetical protein